MKIDFLKLNEKQNQNYQAAVNAYKVGSLSSSFRPVVLYIELTRNCISKCAFCRPSNFKNKNENNISTQVFNILRREYLPYAILVDLNGWGESLILSDFSRYVSEIASFGPKIRITTTLGCGDSKALTSLVEHDVFVAVSFDSANSIKYESIRRGVHFRNVVRNLEWLVNALIKKNGTLEGKIRIEIHPLQGKNLDDVEGILQLAIRYGIKEILLGPLGSHSTDKNLLGYHKEKTKKTLAICVDYARKYGLHFRLSMAPFQELNIFGKSFERCCHPWFYALVNIHGDLIFCDHLGWPGYQSYAFGNICENPNDVWNGLRANRVRFCHNAISTSDFDNYCSPCVRCYHSGRYADFEPDLHPQFNRWVVSEVDLEQKLKEITRAPSI